MEVQELISLPEDILVILIAGWLYLDDIVRWDSAICSRYWRNCYHSAFSKIKEIILPIHMQHIYTEIWFEWLTMRGIVLKTLSTYSFGVLRTNTFIAKNLKELNTLVLNSSSSREIGWLHGLMPHCENLLSIEIRHNQYINPQVTLLQFYCPNLQSLCLIGYLSNPLSRHFPENKALAALITTHQRLREVVVLNVKLHDSIIEECAASGKVLIYTAPCAAYSKATCGEKMELAMVGTENSLYNQHGRYCNCSANEAVRLLHKYLHDGDMHHVSIAACANVNLLLHKFSSLFQLELTTCTELTAAQLATLSTAPHLENIYLRSNQTLQNVDFAQHHVPNRFLHTLKMIYFVSLQKEGMLNILKHCVRLKSLTVQGTPNISYDWLQSNYRRKSARISCDMH